MIESLKQERPRLRCCPADQEVKLRLFAEKTMVYSTEAGADKLESVTPGAPK